MKTVLLVDGSNFLYRAFHGLPDLRTSAGEPTGAIKGFANMLKMIRSMIKPDFAACVFDAHGGTLRDQIYSQYKANRPPMPEDLASQVEPIFSMVKAQGWPFLQVPGIEADDVIGTLAKQAEEKGFKVFIATGDKDMSQLVTDNVFILNTMTRQILNAEAVKEKYGVAPDKIIDYLSLMGDAVDNVPGITKCGPKTAAKWVNEFGGLDEIVKRADEVKGKAGEYLREGLAFLPTAKALVTIKTDADLSQYVEQSDVSTLTFKEEDSAFLTDFYARWEMQQSKKAVQNKSVSKPKIASQENLTADLFASIPAEPQQKPQAVETSAVTIIDSESALFSLREKLEKAQNPVSFTLLCDPSDGMHAAVTGLGLALQNETFYVPVKREATQNGLTDQELQKELGPWFASDSPKVSAECKYARHALANMGIELNARTEDVTLLSYVIEAHMKHDLANLSLRWLKEDVPSLEDLIGKGAKQISCTQVPMDEAARFCATRTLAIGKLFEILRERVNADIGLKSIYETVELPTQNVLFIMERNGVLIDSMRLGAQSDALGDEIVRLEDKCCEMAGERFNVASPKQLSHILFDVLQIPVPPKTKKTATGGYSTNEDVLQQLALDYPLPKAILEYRRLSKLKSTYTDKLPMMVFAKTGRVHTTFGQTTAVTGRLASSDPNLQNIPVRTGEGRRVREAFVAPTGSVIVSADYSQIELRIMAHLSGDAGLLNAFHQGLDIHRATAAEVFGVALDKVSPDQRRTAKVINFGLIYGMSAFGLAQNLGIEPQAAKNYIERYFARYPGVKAYMEKTRALAHEQGFVQTAFGRRLWLPDIMSSRAPVRAAAERAAINAPMQGTAADLIKKAMIAVQAWLEEKQLKSLLVLQVHDELVLEVPESELTLVKESLPELMQNVAQLTVPLIAEVGFGDSWESAH